MNLRNLQKKLTSLDIDERSFISSLELIPDNSYFDFFELVKIEDMVKQCVCQSTFTEGIYNKKEVIEEVVYSSIPIFVGENTVYLENRKVVRQIDRKCYFPLDKPFFILKKISYNFDYKKSSKKYIFFLYDKKDIPQGRIPKGLFDTKRLTSFKLKYKALPTRYDLD